MATNFLICDNCQHKNTVTSERIVFCNGCQKKLANNYLDWKKGKFNSPLEEKKIYFKELSIKVYLKTKQSSSSMAILNSIASWLMKKRMHQIELFMKYPNDVQDEWLYELLKSAKDTEFGILHGFKSIKNYEQFKQHIPTQDYESLKPYIERTRRGEQNLLWDSEIKWFAKSSGTTDKSKFIPVSKEFLNGCHYNGGRDMITFQ